MAIVSAVEDQVLALNGFSVELTAEDLYTWTKAYKEDKSNIVAYTKLRQGQKYQDLCLNLSSLMVRMVEGQ